MPFGAPVFIMIKLEYDKQKAGTRVSFVITDGTHSAVRLPKPLAEYGGETVDCGLHIKQDVESLELVLTFLKEQIRQEAQYE